MKAVIRNICYWTPCKIILRCLFAGVCAPFAIAGNSGVEASKLQLTAHPNGIFSLISNGAVLEELLDKISETTSIDIYIDAASKQRPVSIRLDKVGLMELLKRVVGDNYLMSFDEHLVTALHVLPESQEQSSIHASVVSEFSGKIKISEQRAKLFFMPADNSKNSIDDYIKRRHAVLAKLSKEMPDKKLHAQVSFQSYLTAEQLVAFVRNNHLQPISLAIGWKDNGGGYDLKQNESIEMAIGSAISHHKRFLIQLQEDANAQMAGLRRQAASSAEMQSVLEFQKSIADLNSVFQTRGVPFYGIQVAGRAQQLSALVNTDKNKIIRLVDPLWGGSVEKEIEVIYPVTKIAIPLIPAHNDFLSY